MTRDYYPSRTIIERYADLLVRYSCNAGKGLKKGDTVLLTAHEDTKPLFMATREAIWKAGGHVISRYLPNEDVAPGNPFLLQYGTDQQIKYFPKEYYKGLIDTIDQIILIDSEVPNSLEGVDPKKINLAKRALGPYFKMRRYKEQQEKLFWTICQHGNLDEAKEAGLTYKEYWNQIIRACYLDYKDPVAKFKELNKKIHKYMNKLTAMQIDKIHIKSSTVDLHVKIGEKRKWLGGSGYNIPSFEIFTSPDWRGTEGYIKFDMPLYRNGTLMKGIELTFEKGRVVKAVAKKNEAALKAMIANKNADKLGEVSLTDKRFSRINKFMATTLYDENFGGKYGNTHVAIGASFDTTYDGDLKKLTEAKRKSLGFNVCETVHTDMFSTTNRVVTATLKDGSERVIYKDGKFTI